LSARSEFPLLATAGLDGSESRLPICEETARVLSLDSGGMRGVIGAITAVTHSDRV
jgi:hypothetical protein